MTTKTIKHSARFFKETRDYVMKLADRCDELIDQFNALVNLDQTPQVKSQLKELEYLIDKYEIPINLEKEITRRAESLYYNPIFYLT